MDNTYFAQLTLMVHTFSTELAHLAPFLALGTIVGTLLAHFWHTWHTSGTLGTIFGTLLAHYFKHFSTILVYICVKSIKHGKYWILKYRTPEQNAKIVPSGKS